ncbi:angiopoietin-related protein 3-like [Nothobranchius furzeri]|uniref:Angiopoietin-related protein 3-like n=1 Tax=Nothobranchius furzeri TaxID=105023 RepID=A0A9D2YNR0_NOTFU|nr:angiopoietin-related protein 3-like [Nothobranchius furzeri]
MRLTPAPLVLLLLVSVLCDKQESPDLNLPADTWTRFAPLDDVRLLSNGLLQLGQSMREFVQKTKGQISSIFQKLTTFDRSFYQLSALAGEIKEEEEELKKTTVILKASNEEIKNLSEKISSKMENLLQEKSQLQNKVEGLEQKLNNLSPGLVSDMQAAEINSLRGVIRKQAQSITELLKAMTEQSEQLNQQKTKIKSLEENITASMSVQETFGKTPNISNSERPALSPFLTSDLSSTVMEFPSDCSELFSQGEQASGIYSVRPRGSEPFAAYCDMSREHGATVIQRRSDGYPLHPISLASTIREFWLGLKKIHSLTSQGNSVLQIQLEDWKHNKQVIDYKFNLDGPDNNYTIHLTRLSGSLPDPLSNHTGVMFSTTDRDNQECPNQKSGGWWFNTCADTSLNGRYFRVKPNGRSERRRGIQWRSGRKVFSSLRFSQISVRSVAFPTPASADSSLFL